MGDEDHPLAGVPPGAEGEEQDEELAQALEASVDVAIVAEANVAKGGKSLECVSVSCASYCDGKHVLIQTPLGDIVDIAVVAEANTVKGGESLECVSASAAQDSCKGSTSHLSSARECAVAD